MIFSELKSLAIAQIINNHPVRQRYDDCQGKCYGYSNSALFNATKVAIGFGFCTGNSTHTFCTGNS